MAAFIIGIEHWTQYVILGNVRIFNAYIYKVSWGSVLKVVCPQLQNVGETETILCHWGILFW